MGRLSRIGWGWWYVVLGGLSLGLRAALPPIPLFGSRHDDELQATLAGALLRGEWLGEWTALTLSKGPGYPLFLAGIHPLGLPPTIAQQVIYLGGAGLLAVGLARWGAQPWLGRATFAALALNPAMLSFSASRVYREGLVAALGVLAVGLAVMLALHLRTATPTRRWWAGAIGWSGALGLVLGVLAITRADTIWLAAVCAGILAVGMCVGRSALMAAGVVVVAGALYAIPSAVVAQANAHAYGLRTVDDFNRGPFAQMWSAWVRVQPHSPDRADALWVHQRAPVYAVSPAAERLAPLVEGGSAVLLEAQFRAWVIYEAPLGQVSTASERADYFRQIAEDITRACADGRLTCSGTPVGVGMPVVQRFAWAQVARTMAATLADGLLRMRVAFVTDEVSARSPEAARRGVPGSTVDTGTGAVWSAAVRGLPSPPGVLPRVDSPILIGQQFLARAYSVVWVVMLLPAALGVLLALARSRLRNQLAWVAISCWAGVGAHLGILAIFSVHAANSLADGYAHYLLATAPIALTATVIGVALLAGGLPPRGGPATAVPPM